MHFLKVLFSFVGTGGIIPQADPGAAESPPAFDAGTLKTRREETTRDIVIPAGAVNIDIVMTSPTGTIDVNGETIQFNGRWNRQTWIDHINGNQDLCEEVTVTAGGNSYWWSVVYPSASATDPTTI